jgi:hypothetical protein
LAPAGRTNASAVEDVTTVRAGTQIEGPRSRTCPDPPCVGRHTQRRQRIDISDDERCYATPCFASQFTCDGLCSIGAISYSRGLPESGPTSRASSGVGLGPAEKPPRNLFNRVCIRLDCDQDGEVDHEFNGLLRRFSAWRQVLRLTRGPRFVCASSWTAKAFSAGLFPYQRSPSRRIRSYRVPWPEPACSC